MQIEIMRTPRRSAARRAATTASSGSGAVASIPGTTIVSARRSAPSPWVATIAKPVDVRTGPARRPQTVSS